MKTMLPLLFLSLFLIACSDIDSITASDAKNHKGRMKTIKGVVIDFREAREQGKPHYLNLGKKFPNQDLTIVVFGDFEAKYKKKIHDLKDKTIIFRGTIKEVKGRLQVKNPFYITVEK
jgi:hypothetical protein